jgi:DNA repair protein RadA/Sms
MARPVREFICQSCGAASARWNGRCPGCGAWNTMVEETPAAPVGGRPKSRSTAPGALIEDLATQTADPDRLPSGMNELDRVLGGGLVPGSAVLVGGDPGIGKSTLLLQLAAAQAVRGRRVLYFSGEEAAQQIRLRAARLGVSQAPVGLAAETSVSAILAALESGPAPDLTIIDSIQTLWTEILDSAPGTVSQVRASVQALTSHAKRRGSVTVMVGHVTKDGQIAGPKVVEHMVDAVLYFEGENQGDFRLLRSVKNRFGPTGEIGVFEMRGDGLKEVSNPSALFLSERENICPGAAVFAGVEGTRPLLVEIQALAAPSPFAAPRRAAVGFDINRLSMILAVLDARCGVKLGAHDIYLNVAGGLRIAEPAADLAAAAALVSSFSGVALPSDCVYFGEVSLSGAIRTVGQMGLRLKEAQKLGFTSAVIPALGEMPAHDKPFPVTRLKHLGALADSFEGAAPPRDRTPGRRRGP